MPMKKTGIIFLTVIALLYVVSPLHAQQYFGGRFVIKEGTNRGHLYRMYVFSKADNTIKAKYFAENAYAKYQSWKPGKNILLVTAGAFSDSFAVGGKPIGLCIDNGQIINKSPDPDMDALVMVYNQGAAKGNIWVADLDDAKMTVPTDTGKILLTPRQSMADRVRLLNWGKRAGITLFQTQLLYAAGRAVNFSPLTFGKKKERRFLALCKSGNQAVHIVVDAPALLQLNLSASYAKELLESEGYIVAHLLNLDTGGKDILYVSNGRQLENKNPTAINSFAVIEKATNLLVFYKE
jgi:hypothetical protein